MNAELEKEAEKYARRFEENEQYGYNGESLSPEDRMEVQAFVAGATSKYVEKQKLEFTIKQLKSIVVLEGTNITYVEVNDKMKELEQQLSKL